MEQSQNIPSQPDEKNNKSPPKNINTPTKPPIFTETQFKFIFGILGSALACGMTVAVIEIMGRLFLNKSA